MIKRFRQSLKRGGWLLLVISFMATLVPPLITTAFAQASTLPIAPDASALLEKAGFAGIAAYLIFFITKTQQTMLAALQESMKTMTEAISDNTDTMKKLKWHIERQNLKQTASGDE